MSRPFIRHVYPHPAHPGPDRFSLQELAAWDVELLVWGVRCGYWSAEAFRLTPAGERLLDRFLNYYSATARDTSFMDHTEGELLLYMNQIGWAAPGESVAETELRLAYLHTQFEAKVKQPPDSGDFNPHRFFPDDYDRERDRDRAEEA